MSDLPGRYSIKALLDAAWDGWTYDKYDPENQIRDRSQRLRNTIDEVLGIYMSQIKEEIQDKRRSVPTPTRENPFPGTEKINEIKEKERYLRKIEDLRTQVQGLEVPTKTNYFIDKEEHLNLLYRLEQIDRKIFNRLENVNSEKIKEIEKIIQERRELLKKYSNS